MPGGTVTWVGKKSGLWQTAANWSGSTATADAVVLGGTGSYTVTVNTAATATAVTVADAAATLVVNAAFSITGALDVQAGTLVVIGGALGVGTGSSAGGTFDLTGGLVEIGAGTTLDLAGPVTFGTGTFYTGGTLSGAGTVETGGTTTIPASAYDPTNRPELTAQLFLAGGLAWVNTGLLNDNGVIAFGTIDPVSGEIAAAAATLDNQGTLDLNSNGAALVGDPASGLLVNSGLLIKQGIAASFSGAPDVASIGVAVTNTGTVQSDSGTIEFDGGGSFAGLITGSDTVAFGGGTATLQNGVSLSVATLLINGGTLIAAANVEFGNDLLPVSGAIGATAGNTFTLSGTVAFGAAGGTTAFAVTGAGTVDVTGDATVADGGSAPQLAIAGGATFNIDGTFADAGLIRLGDSGGGVATLTNDANGVTTLTGDDASLLAAGGGGVLHNDGDFAKTGGSGTSTVGVAVYNDGSIHVESGTLALTGAVQNDGGSISAANGTLLISGPVTGTGDLTVGSAGTLELAGAVGAGQTVTFEDTAGLLSLGDIAAFQGTVVVNGVGDQIDVAGVSGAVANVDPGTGLLSFVANGATVDTLQLDPASGALTFLQSGDGHGGTLLTAVGGPLSVTLTAPPVTIIGTTGNDVITAANGTLIAGDTIDGEGGTNTLKLTGGGTFDLTAPAVLANIQTVSAAEGRPAYVGKVSTIASTVQTIWLRNGLDSNVTVASAPAKSINPNSPAIYIHGADNNAVIRLGKGNDTVWVGGNGEKIIGGKGSYIFYLTAASAGAAINGGTGSSQAIVSGGGTVTLNSATTNIKTLTLTGAAAGTTQPDYVFTAGAARKLAITDNSGGNDTIVVGSATQSVTAGSGQDRVVVTAATAGALVTGGAATTLEVQGGGHATLNAATNHVTVQLDAATTLILNKMSFISAIGNSAGGDTIRTGAVGQVVTSQGGNDRLYGSAGFGDASHGVTFLGTAAGLNGDKLVNFGAGDVIDVTDIPYAAAVITGKGHGSYGLVGLSYGSSSTTIKLIGGYAANFFSAATDGHGGTLIRLL